LNRTAEVKLKGLKDKQDFSKKVVKNHFDRLMHRLKSQRKQRSRGQSIYESIDATREAENEVRNEILEQCRIGHLIRDNNFKQDFDPELLMNRKVEVNQNQEDNQKDNMNFMKLEKKPT
jgi:hypothetical protein